MNSGKKPELIEVILGESRKIIRTGGRALIVETHHGFICANAGVDQSNVGMRHVALLPQGLRTVRRAEIRAEIQRRPASSSALMISDSFGRAWRVGHGGCRGRRCRHRRRSRMSAVWRIATVTNSKPRWRRSPMNWRGGGIGDGQARRRAGGRSCADMTYEINEEGSVQELLRPEAEDLFR